MSDSKCKRRIRLQKANNSLGPCPCVVWFHQKDFMPCMTQPGQLISEKYWLEYSRKKKTTPCDAPRSLNELENIRKDVECACVLEAGAGDGAQRFSAKCKQKMLQRMYTPGSGQPLHLPPFCPPSYLLFLPPFFFRSCLREE